MTLGGNLCVALMAITFVSTVMIVDGSKSGRKPTSQRRHTSAAGASTRRKSIRSRLGMGGLWKTKCDATIKFEILDRASGYAVWPEPPENTVTLDISSMHDLEQVHNEALRQVRKKLPSVLKPDIIKARVLSKVGSYTDVTKLSNEILEAICEYQGVVQFDLLTEELEVSLQVNLHTHCRYVIRTDCSDSFSPATETTLGDFVIKCKNKAMAEAEDGIDKNVEYVTRLYCDDGTHVMYNQRGERIHTSNEFEATRVELQGHPLPYFLRFARRTTAKSSCRLVIQEKDFTVHEADAKVYALGKVEQHTCQFELRNSDNYCTANDINSGCLRYLHSVGILNNTNYVPAKSRITVAVGGAVREIADISALATAIRADRARPQLEFARNVWVTLHNGKDVNVAAVFPDTKLIDVFTASGLRPGLGKVIRRNKVQLRETYDERSHKIIEFKSLNDTPFSSLVNQPNACLVFFDEKK